MRKMLLVLLLVGLDYDLVLAQTPRETPDWTGYYTLATARELASTGLKQDFPNEELNNLIIAHLQPWAKARMEATDGIADDTGQVCLPDGIFRYPRAWPAGFYGCKSEDGSSWCSVSSIRLVCGESISTVPIPKTRFPLGTATRSAAGREIRS